MAQGMFVCRRAVPGVRHSKAYDVLLDAARQATAQRADGVFLSVGQGPLAAVMEERCSWMGLGARFRFLGYRDDVPALLAAADIFCLASRHEGLPVALMEAYALGYRSWRPGLPEVVEDGESSLLVPLEDAGALAAAIVAVARDGEWRGKLARRVSQLARQFDSRVAVRRLEAIYEQVSS